MAEIKPQKPSAKAVEEAETTWATFMSMVKITGAATAVVLLIMAFTLV